mmetsp:Transcript_12711/g.37819  ORF Transcript_12711/g.37819 Transcript_12711/m.37819 type:complete len:196 (-) Transcript_12711:91-678(-)
MLQRLAPSRPADAAMPLPRPRRPAAPPARNPLTRRIGHILLAAAALLALNAWSLAYPDIMVIKKYVACRKPAGRCTEAMKVWRDGTWIDEPTWTWIDEPTPPPVAEDDDYHDDDDARPSSFTAPVLARRPRLWGAYWKVRSWWYDSDGANVLAYLCVGALVACFVLRLVAGAGDTDAEMVAAEAPPDTLFRAAAV